MKKLILLFIPLIVSAQSVYFTAEGNKIILMYNSVTNESATLNLKGFDQNSLIPISTNYPDINVANVSVSETNPTSATITWDTDVLSDSTVYWGPSFGYSTNNATLTTNHSIVIDGLTEDSNVSFYVTSTDGLTVDSSAVASFHTTSTTPVISNVALSDTNATDAVIGWTVVPDATPNVVDVGTDTSYGVGSYTNVASLGNPSITITNLTAATTYYTQVRSYANSMWVTNVGPTFSTPPAASCVIVYTYGSSSANLKIFDGTGYTNVATKITMTTTNIHCCNLEFLLQRVSTLTGTLVADIYADDAGGSVPGTLLTSSAGVNIADIPSDTLYWINFSLAGAEEDLINGTTYWFGLRSSTAGSATKYINVKASPTSTGTTTSQTSGTWSSLSTRLVRVATFTD